MTTDEIDKLLLALPIRPENLARLTQIRREVAALAKDRDDWRREWDLYARSWLRNLGGSIFNKRHRIDALAMTTEHQRIGYERAKEAGLIGETFYRNDPRSDKLKLSAFLCAIRDRFKAQAALTDVEATVHALAALETWEDAKEPVELTAECAKEVADTDLAHWDSD